MNLPAGQPVYGNRYRVLEPVGSGGMATVYRGVDTVLGRDVAIKVMHPHLAARADARARFSREAKAIARLKHPNIVDVYDFSGDSDLEAYLVTEFVHGITLTEFCSRHGQLLPQSAALIAHAIAGALAHAHAAGLVHRDIKPDNLMISRDGTIKLMDFGIATALDMEQMTATGAILGSPAHMAPEQIEGRAIDARVDVFAFGTVLYTLVAGRLPFVASNPHALFRLILECEYDPPSRHNPAVGRGFEQILTTALARQPEDRWSSMAAVQEALTGYLTHFDLQDIAAHLPRLLQAPEQFQLELRPKLVRVLCADGRAHARQGELALAIDDYNRALAIDPEAADPRVGLSELTSRSRRRRRIRAVAIAGVGAAVAVAAIILVGRAPSRPQAPSAPVVASALPLAVPAAPETARMVAAEKAALDAEAARQEKARQEQRALAEEAARVALAEAAKARDAEAAAAARPREPDAAAQRPTRPRPVKADEAQPSRPAGPTVVATPNPTGGKVLVGLGSLPPISVIFLDGVEKSRTGVWTEPLIPGRDYTLRCEPYPSSCPSCPAFQERRFKVPERPAVDGTPFSVKCDFRAFQPAHASGG